MSCQMLIIVAVGINLSKPSGRDIGSGNELAMSELTIGSYVMPAAEIGAENPLTPLRAYETASAAGATAGTSDYPDRGREESILPYRLQDGYSRQRSPRAFKTAVLENRH